MWWGEVRMEGSQCGVNGGRDKEGRQEGVKREDMCQNERD